jgi:predicted ester cyclase
MTRDDIVAMFERRQEALARLDATALAADHTDDSVLESPFAGKPTTGRDAITAVYESYFKAFNDIAFTQEDLLVDGDRVALIERVSGTDTGGVMGMTPTGRKISYQIAILYDLRDGRISRERRVYDFTGVLLQIGALKAKPI